MPHISMYYLQTCVCDRVRTPASRARYACVRVVPSGGRSLLVEDLLSNVPCQRYVCCVNDGSDIWDVSDHSLDDFRAVGCVHT